MLAGKATRRGLAAVSMLPALGVRHRGQLVRLLATLSAFAILFKSPISRWTAVGRSEGGVGSSMEGVRGSWSLLPAGTGAIEEPPKMKQVTCLRMDGSEVNHTVEDVLPYLAARRRLAVATPTTTTTTTTTRATRDELALPMGRLLDIVISFYSFHEQGLADIRSWANISTVASRHPSW